MKTRRAGAGSLWAVGKHAKVGESKPSVDAGGDDERTKLGG